MRLNLLDGFQKDFCHPETIDAKPKPGYEDLLIILNIFYLQ
ncbi:MAG: hypothetical protein ACI93N_001028 [Flavobacteriaceae bacterium]|jgi:hypothetical protein